MTCIAALVDCGRVWMAGDRCLTDEDGQVSISRHPKVFQIGPYLMGCAGSLAVMQAVEHRFKPAATPNGAGNLMRHLVCEVVPAIRTLSNEVDAEDAPNLLIGLHGRLFSIDGEGAVQEHERCWAIGAGSAWANGSLASTSGDPEMRLRIALQLAAEHAEGVRPPFDVLSPEPHP